MSEIKYNKEGDLDFGGEGGLRVRNNFTNGFLDPQNLCRDGFVRKNVSEIKKTLKILTLIFREGGGPKIDYFFVQPENLYGHNR